MKTSCDAKFKEMPYDTGVSQSGDFRVPLPLDQSHLIFTEKVIISGSVG